MTGRAVALTLAAAAALLAGCGQQTSPPAAATATPSAALAAQSAPQQLLLLAAAQGQQVTAVRWDTRGLKGTVTVTDTTSSTDAPRVIPVRSESPSPAEPTDAILLVDRDGRRVGSLALTAGPLGGLAHPVCNTWRAAPEVAACRRARRTPHASAVAHLDLRNFTALTTSRP